MQSACFAKNAPVNRSIPLYNHQPETALGFTSFLLLSDSVPAHLFFTETSSPLYIIWACARFATASLPFLRNNLISFDKNYLHK